MLNPQKRKYHNLYWDVAYRASLESTAIRCKVGCVIVTPSGMLSIGFNGMPEGLPNDCEPEVVYDHSLGRMRGKTDPRVIHAEHNALRKMWSKGIPTKGCLLMTTLSPCLPCAKLLVGIGLRAVIYDLTHDCEQGIHLLKDVGVPVYQRYEHYDFPNQDKGYTLPS